MISFFKSTFHISDAQKEIQRILRHMTGLGVHPVPMPSDHGVPNTAYLFKCRHSEACLNAPADARQQMEIMEIHDFQGYIKKVLAVDTEAGLDDVTIEIVPDPDDPKNEIWPCVRVRFCTLAGAPHSDNVALAIVGKLESRLKEYARQHMQNGAVAPLPGYQKKLRKKNGFEDAYDQKK
ncbi:MAG: hypothetical protein KGI29_03825 [Pseudomonadota bacterium]|nr:hypothetical protein [Pseudomonadota bacterium]MDE3038317.1 hypothetical protein [Pseudomonadota bacterium]